MKMQKKYSKKQTTSFQEKVYKIVMKIPEGRIMTYKEVAKTAGSPLAFRAVGNALNKNPDLKTIPCHRVIKSDGRIGGYNRGGRKKIALLKREGIIINHHGRIAS